MDKYGFIGEQMDILAVPYMFGEWTEEKITYPYVVGEDMPEPITTEDGKEVSAFILTITHRGLYTDMEIIKEKIRKHFHQIHGLSGKTDSGSITVWYENAFYVPTGEKDLKRMQINLNIKEWKGDL